MEETERKLASCSICNDTKHDSYCEHVKTRVIIDPDTGERVYAIIGSLDLMKTIRSACKCYAASATAGRRRTYNSSKLLYLNGKIKTINTNWKKTSYLVDVDIDVSVPQIQETNPPPPLAPLKFKIPSIPPLPQIQCARSEKERGEGERGR